jgi:beta-carotene 3-hydroxylase
MRELAGMPISYLLLTVATLVVMEWAVTLAHKHVMHGIGWRWHRSHHEGHRNKGWEKNDLYAVVFSIATVLLFVLGDIYWPVWWIALGITLYGLIYAFLHDVITHRRLPVKWQVKHPYIRRLVTAHRMHHAAQDRHSGVSYGFLYAPPVEVVRQQLRASLEKK